MARGNLMIKSSRILAYGIVITDNNGAIMNCNDIAKVMFKCDNLCGKSIEEFKAFFDSYYIGFTKMFNQNVYVIKNNNDTEFWDIVLQDAHDEIFITDKNGVALYCNNAFEKHYGMPKEDIIGKNVKYLEDNHYADKIFMPLLLKTKKQITFEQKTITNRTILNTSTPIIDDNNEILYVVENCRDITELQNLKNDLNKTLNELQIYKSESKFSNNFIKKKSYEFISPKMNEAHKAIENLAAKDVNILILGQSGTGKTFMAKKIHEKSNRAKGPFITINCTTIPENLLESELFGYSKGAFTGASSNGKRGLVELSNGGTLFLDEIGELPLYVQSKLLELVQEKTFLPIGDTKLKYADTRIIAATNKDLMQLVNEKKFRNDLYYRLAVATINVPPLQELPQDIERLLDFYLKLYNEKHNLNVNIEKDTRIILLNYSWPGNIRELQHLIEFLVLTCTNNIIKTDDLPNYILKTSNIVKNIPYEDNTSLDSLIEKEERKIIQDMYALYKSSYKLAKKLGISQSKASRLIRKYCTSKELSQI